jgi:predicted nucleic acid-binding protein
VKVVVDTPIWSLALRRKAAISPETERLRKLWRNGEAALIGPARQELLSGVRDPKHFALLRDQLRVEPDYPLDSVHFERAAEMYNLCLAKGIQGSNVDFLICAVSELDRLSVFTTDRDFEHFADVLSIRLVQ